MKVYDNTPESLNFMKKTLYYNSKVPRTSVQRKSYVSNEEEQLKCVDDTILKEFKDDFIIEKDKNSLFKNVKDLEYGENFGCNFNEILKKSDFLR